MSKAIMVWEITNDIRLRYKKPIKNSLSSLYYKALFEGFISKNQYLKAKTFYNYRTWTNYHLPNY